MSVKSNSEIAKVIVVLVHATKCEILSSGTLLNTVE